VCVFWCVLKKNDWCQLLSQLRERMDSDDWKSGKKECIGDIFVKISPFFKLYSVYVSNCTCHVSKQ